MVGWSVPGVVHLREVREDSVGRRVAARHRITRRSLAVTYLSDELFADTEFRARFARDFGRLTRVRDARVPRVHRYVECRHGAAVIGDHVNGIPLRALLLAHGAVGIEAALVVLKDSLRGLAVSHAAGVAHGDIKPEGVILTRAGCVRLVDFGLSTPHGRRLLARSTPFYLAPEQWSGCPATPAGDVYAATVTFFECLVGAPPFYADDVAELSAKHEHSTPPIDVIPEPARELVLRGIAKDPHSRPDARSLLGHVDDVACHAVGTGWEQRGRRELARLLDGRSALPVLATPARQRGSVGWEPRQPVRLAAVVGGALVLAAGLSSPPLAVILPGGSIFGSDARSPVLAFPEPVHGTSPVRAVTNGRLADRAPHSAPAAKANPAGRPLVAPAQPNKELSPRSSPLANPRIALAEHPPRGGYPAGSVHRNEVVQPQPAPGPAGTAAGTTSAQVPASIELPVSIQLPVSIELPVSIQLPAPIHERAQPQKEIRTLKNARNREGTRTQESADTKKQTEIKNDTHTKKDTHSQTQTHPQRGQQTERAVDSHEEQRTEAEHN
ncbi:MAG: serine/threonine protein kinase [Pseudonocardiaceae bacterium]